MSWSRIKYSFAPSEYSYQPGYPSSRISVYSLISLCCLSVKKVWLMIFFGSIDKCAAQSGLSSYVLSELLRYLHMSLTHSLTHSTHSLTHSLARSLVLQDDLMSFMVARHPRHILGATASCCCLTVTLC